MPFDYKKGFKEFYLPPTKPRKTSPEKLRTVIRHPIRRVYNEK
ncbi:hypothetical protein [Treponema bryantii]|nr:hypothetical protein [Treponema bryantii]